MTPTLTKLAVASLMFVLPGTAFAGPGPARFAKLDRELRAAAEARDARPRRVIIQARSAADRDALRKALVAHGDAVVAEHPSLNALTVTLHGGDLSALAADGLVTAVSSDAEVTVTGVKRTRAAAERKARRPRFQNSAAVTRSALRETLGLDAMSGNGTGIGVAVLDSGIDPNADLANSLKGFWDFTKGGIPTEASDDYGHGTHVAGLIASTGSLSKGQFEGVAPGVRLFGLKVLDKNGRGKSSNVLRAIDFVVANRRTLGIDVINLSLGHPILESAATDPLVQAVERAVRAGIVVVTAAGNVGTTKSGATGYAGILSPGNAPSALTVGAADTKGTAAHGDDRVAWFSSRGPTWYDAVAKPDLVAPGVGLTSDAPKGATLYAAYPNLVTVKWKTDFGVLSGTSMAAAVTTGVVAVVLEAGRASHFGASLTPNTLKAILQYSALPVLDDSGDEAETLAQGAGEINARGAAELALAIDPRVPVGRRWTFGQPPAVTWIGGSFEEWSRELVWGGTLVSDSDVLWTHSALFNENIVWGTLALAGGENIVWGTLADTENIVWGTSETWASNLVWGDELVGLRMNDENIVWGTVRGGDGENIVWGTLNGENIVWGTLREAGENIVWGTSALIGGSF